MTLTIACPRCRNQVDLVADECDPPSRGDVIVCPRCIGILVFTNSAGAMREANQEDYDSMSDDLRALAKAVAELQAPRRIYRHRFN